jgi:tetratricopeptide (TPR) repeat protein
VSRSHRRWQVSLWAVATVLSALPAGVGVFWWRGRPERHLARAEQAVAEGDREAALAWLVVPQASGATRDRALLLRARMAVEQGNLAGAVRALDRVDSHGPHAAEFAFWKGRTLYAARQPMLAMEWFQKTLALAPGSADAHRWLAAAAYDLGDRRAAIAALEAVTRLCPDDARAWRTLGLIFKENETDQRARTAFEAALERDLGRDRPAVQLELAEVLVRLGDAGGARRQLEACRGQVAEAACAELLGQCCRLVGDGDGQRAAVDAGLAAAPDHPGLLTQRAAIDFADGHPEEALVRLDRALAADPFRSETVYRRALALRILGRHAEAARDFARAAELNTLMTTMSELNAKAAADPRDADVRDRLGRLCVELGKPELAASWYRAALACDPGHASARLGLAVLRGRTGRSTNQPR